MAVVAVAAALVAVLVIGKAVVAVEIGIVVAEWCSVDWEQLVVGNALEAEPIQNSFRKIVAVELVSSSMVALRTIVAVHSDRANR